MIDPDICKMHTNICKMHVHILLMCAYNIRKIGLADPIFDVTGLKIGLSGPIFGVPGRRIGLLRAKITAIRKIYCNNRLYLIPGINNFLLNPFPAIFNRGSKSGQFRIIDKLKPFQRTG